MATRKEGVGKSECAEHVRLMMRRWRGDKYRNLELSEGEEVARGVYGDLRKRKREGL